MDICAEIKEAKCCSLNMGAQYAEAATFGNQTDEMFFNYLRLNSYIRTLTRFEEQNHKRKKLCDWKCLTEKQICGILEEIKLLCSQCGCNCN